MFWVLYSTPVSPQAPGTLIDPDTYAVYNVLIPSDWLLRVAHASELLIQDTTEVDSPLVRGCLPSGPEVTGPWLEALSEFKTQQTTSRALDRQFSLPVPYRFESRDTILSFCVKAGPLWEGFHAAHPQAKGYLTVSAVGFDKTHKHALAYMAHFCNMLCGQGGYHFVERAPDGWREVRVNGNNCMWVS